MTITGWKKWCKTNEIHPALVEQGRNLFEHNPEFWSMHSVELLYTTVEMEIRAHANPQ